MARDLNNWIGKTETQQEFAQTARLQQLSALLDDRTTHWQAGLLPPLFHWFYCQPIAPQRDIDEDGHIKRGGFIPPIALPYRMWASSDVVFHEPVALNQILLRRSEIMSLTPKKNKNNEDLIFLTIRHEITGEKSGRVEERQHIVYKALAGIPSAPAKKAEQVSETSAEVAFDITRLFRFSAITFNAHRIHTDRDYAKSEGYPGLVVHGPYLAFLLLHHFLAHRKVAMRAFSFRAERPLFDTSPPAKLCFAGNQLWLESEAHEILMRAEVEVSE